MSSNGIKVVLAVVIVLALAVVILQVSKSHAKAKALRPADTGPTDREVQTMTDDQKVSLRERRQKESEQAVPVETETR